MGTLIWLVITTVIGALVGHLVFDHMWIGAVAGFFVGVLVRLGAADDAIDLFD